MNGTYSILNLMQSKGMTLKHNQFQFLFLVAAVAVVVVVD